jgi:GNAT superfamily N-acetyltransferase
VKISLATVDDAPRAATLFKTVFDDRVITETGIRYRMANIVPEDRLHYWRAEREGELAGWAVGGLDAFAAGDTTAIAGIVVHPDHRREGIGRALWEVVSRHLEEIGARRIVAYSRAEDASRSFARGCGFTLDATSTTSALDPRTLGPPPEPPDGIAIVPMERFEDDPEAVFAADRESALDEPGPSDFSGTTYEDWLRMIWNTPDCDLELSVVALADGVVVGTSFLYTDRESGRAGNAGTGVLPAFRGRGIALLMKQHSLARAAASGIATVITQNDDTNAPMLAINARLGYEPLSSSHGWVLER